jgi:hypothetical protein
MRDNEMATLAQRAKRQTVSCHLHHLRCPSSCNEQQHDDSTPSRPEPTNVTRNDRGTTPGGRSSTPRVRAGLPRQRSSTPAPMRLAEPPVTPVNRRPLVQVQEEETINTDVRCSRLSISSCMSSQRWYRLPLTEMQMTRMIYLLEQG